MRLKRDEFTIEGKILSREEMNYDLWDFNDHYD
jgi:hypothetical protein